MGKYDYFLHNLNDQFMGLEKVLRKYFKNRVYTPLLENVYDTINVIYLFYNYKFPLFLFNKFTNEIIILRLIFWMIIKL